MRPEREQPTLSGDFGERRERERLRIVLGPGRREPTPGPCPVHAVWRSVGCLPSVSPSHLLLPELCFPTPRPAQAVTSCDQLSASC